MSPEQHGCDGGCDRCETPIPRITIRELKTLLDGYCDTCPYLGDADHHCEQNCAIPRIHADLDRFTDKCVEEGLKPLRWKIETQGAVPTGLAWKFTNENTGCVRHGDD